MRSAARAKHAIAEDAGNEEVQAIVGIGEVDDRSL
jgi:hypothetical protein